VEAGTLLHIGPDLVCGRLRKELGLNADQLLKERGSEFPVERDVYLTVLHRLFGSDRGRGALAAGCPGARQQWPEAAPPVPGHALAGG
jgi:hypothetical protein